MSSTTEAQREHAVSDETAAMLAAGRDDLIVYSLLVDPRYRANRFHRHLAKVIERAVARGHGRIMIFAPPQHGKSEIVSRKAPAWIMGKHPDWPIIAASYGDDLVELNGGAVRAAVTSPMHRAIFPGCSLDPSTTAKANFSTTEGGKYLGVTIRGGGTGFPAKVFIIDDPFKSRAEADSDTFREHVKNWYRSVVYTRLAEDSPLRRFHHFFHQRLHGLLAQTARRRHAGNLQPRGLRADVRVQPAGRGIDHVCRHNGIGRQIVSADEGRDVIRGILLQSRAGRPQVAAAGRGNA